jgi:exosortase/archaeosortase family protein
MTEGQAALSRGATFESPKALTYQAIGVVALIGLVYMPILQAMVNHWKIDPDYSHGFLIVPLSLYFAYEKKYELEAATIKGSWWGLAPLLLGLGILAFGQLGSLLTPLRASFVFSLMGIVLLMVPLPQSLVNVIAFPLQLIAAQWAVSSLQMLGIPVLLEGNIIHMAGGDLFVAEACSGLRSLMALLTLGVVFAHFFRRGQPIQQVILVVSTIPIAIFVNAIRVAITGFLAHHWGQDAAGGVIHEFQGMITFSIAFVLLLGEAKLLEQLAHPRTGAGSQA